MIEKDQTPIMFQFFTEIGIIEQLIRAKLERALPDGIKISQFSVLHHLTRLQGKWSPARLANAFQVTKAAMTNFSGC
jgi:DNA-binding MarR family transcriptional regulator